MQWAEGWIARSAPLCFAAAIRRPFLLLTQIFPAVADSTRAYIS